MMLMCSSAGLPPCSSGVRERGGWAIYTSGSVVPSMTNGTCQLRPFIVLCICEPTREPEKPLQEQPHIRDDTGPDNSVPRVA